MKINFAMNTYNLSTYDKKLAVLIDPDKSNEKSIDALFSVSGIEAVDYIFVGGSLLVNDIDFTIGLIKSNTRKPVIIFPGNAFQISSRADAFLLLSLISGRNPDMLIGHHVMAAPRLKKLGIPVVSTAYMLFDAGRTTSVQYMSNTQPLPIDKPEIAIATALAGELIGMKQVYLEAGSGAAYPVPNQIISDVARAVQIPVIVGGGIRSATQAGDAWNAGANLVVIGNAAETNPALISQLANVRAAL